MIFPDLRTSLVQALSRELQAGSVLLSVGLPGSGPIRVLERSRDGFATFEALSLPLLEAYPDYAESLLADRARPVLAERDGEAWLGDDVPVGGHMLARSHAPIRHRSFAALVGTLAGPGFVYLGPIAGHMRMLAGTLTDLAAGPALIWIDLPGPERQRKALQRDLLSAPGAERFAVYAVSAFGLRRAGAPDADAASLLLVPLETWDPVGLEALAAAGAIGAEDEAAAAASLATPLIRRSQGIGADLAARLRVGRARASLGRVPVPEKALLPVAGRVWGAGVRPVRDESGTLLLQTRWQPTARLMFMAPPGHYRIGVVTLSQPKAQMLAGLQVTAGPGRVPLRWIPEWWQFTTRAATVEIPDAEPVEILFRMASEDRFAPLDLLISGIEIESRHDSLAAGAAIRLAREAVRAQQQEGRGHAG